nr:type IV pilin protein [Vibrio maerlii]
MEMILRNECKATSNQHHGMTLIELLIVVAILGVLASLAYPSYTQHIILSQRTSALADMSRIQLQLEKDFDGNSYKATNVVKSNSNQCDTDDSDGNVFCHTATDRYVITIATTTTGYTITATAQSATGQTNDTCLGIGTTMTLNEKDVLMPEECGW